MQRSKMLDLTQGSPLKQIILFGLPMLFGNVFQQLYNLVDSYVVGNYVGANALAAVGTCGAPLMIFIGMSFGFFNGAGVVVAQLRGAGRAKDAKSAVSTCLILMVALAVFMTGFGMVIYRWLLRVMKVPASIYGDAADYLRIYIYGLFFLFLYNCLAALLRALGDSMTPLYFLIVACVLNIILDVYFVVKLGMAVRGVAWATFIGQAVSAVGCAVYAAFRVPFFRYRRGEFTFSGRLLRDILRLGIPSGIQTSVASIGFIFVQTLVNGFGEANIAAYAAASKMERLSHMTSESFTQALATYVGQNIGAGKMDRVEKGRRDCFLFTGALAILTSVVILWIGPALINLFVDASETVVIQRGAAYLRAYAPFLIVFVFMSCNASTLRGAGDALWSMIVFLCDLLFRSVMAWVLCAIPAIGFMGTAWSIPCGWGLAALIGFIRFRSGKWRQKAVTAR